MASGRPLDRPVRPRKEEVSNYDDLGADPGDGVSEGELGSEPDDLSTDENSSKDNESEASHDPDTSPEDEPEEHTELKEISFGALAQAHAALGPVSRKRKQAEASASAEEIREKSWKNDDRKPKENTSRTSKHAPAIRSSRRAVSRRLEVFDPSPGLKARDPRFDPLVQSSNADPNASSKANKNYSFLTSYQADEVLALKSQIKKSKTPDDAAALKQQLMSLESKLRRAEVLNREKEILRKHKQEEREAIKSGAKETPYFLKKSDVKKTVLTQRFEGMGKKARYKAMERKRKRVKGKESRDMPRLRRERHTD